MTMAGRCPNAVRLPALGCVALLAGCAAPQAPAAPDPPPLFTADQFRLPATLAESLRALERLLPADVQAAMRQGREDQMLDYHHPVGRWIRNEWLDGFGEKPLRRWFEHTHRVQYSDDMSGIVLRSFWRQLNDRPLDVEDQAREVRAWNARHPPPPPPPTAKPKP
jgi:hypothetical protein